MNSFQPDLCSPEPLVEVCAIRLGEDEPPCEPIRCAWIGGTPYRWAVKSSGSGIDLFLVSRSSATQLRSKRLFCPAERCSSIPRPAVRLTRRFALPDRVRRSTHDSLCRTIQRRLPLAAARVTQKLNWSMLSASNTNGGPRITSSPVIRISFNRPKSRVPGSSCLPAKALAAWMVR